MYEALIKRLRSHNGWALNETLNKAADAIEELSCKYQKALDDLVNRAELPKEKQI